MSTELGQRGEPTFLETISQVTLPPVIEELITEYETLCGDRDRFLWQWIYSLFPEFTLSTVDPATAEHVRCQKMLLTIYVTVLDDLVENHADRATFEEARRLIRAPETVDADRTAVSEEYFAFIETVWKRFEEGLEDAPRGEEFQDVFDYDIQQTMNAMDYSAVVNETPEIANLSGSERYDAHNMVMFAYADVDLMYSPTFDLDDYGTLRDLLWDLQEMARIGNWLTTWEREVKEDDYTAGIVVLALQEGLVTTEEIRGSEREKQAVVERIKAENVEQRFRDRWADLYESVRDRDLDAESVDLDGLVSGMETVFQYHVESRGYK